MNELLDATEKPNWFEYPVEFLKIIQTGLIDIGPWQFLLGKWLRVRHDGLGKRYPERALLPFARRLDNDDVACWEQGQQGRVFVVHDFSSPGWERRDEYVSFAAWLEAAQEDAKDYDD